MIFEPYLDWLGFKTRRPVVGVHITSTHITLAALRRRPVRLVAIGHRPVPDAAVVGGEIRTIEPLAAALREMAAEIRIGSASPAVAVIEPLADDVALGVDGSPDANCDVAGPTLDRLVEVVVGAGLRLIGVEVVPAALARLGQRVGAPAVVLDAPTGWSVAAGQQRLHANRITEGAARATLRVGLGMETASVVADLPGVVVPDALRHLVDPGRDAIAVGGALVAFGHGPHIVARPTAVSLGSGWTVQRVDEHAQAGSRANAPLPL